MSLRLHAVCRRGYCVFPAVAAPFGFRALSGCRPVYLLGVGHYDFNLVFQSEIIRLAPEATAIAMSVYSGIYNVGIGAGALVGGFVCTHASIARIGYAGGAIALLAALFCLVRLVPLLKRSRG